LSGYPHFCVEHLASRSMVISFPGLQYFITVLNYSLPPADDTHQRSTRRYHLRPQLTKGDCLRSATMQYRWRLIGPCAIWSSWNACELSHIQRLRMSPLSEIGSCALQNWEHRRYASVYHRGAFRIYGAYGVKRLFWSNQCRQGQCGSNVLCLLPLLQCSVA
jgi:hypothetical protein